MTHLPPLRQQPLAPSASSASPASPASSAPDAPSVPGALKYPLTLYYDGGCPLCLAEMHNLMLRNREGLLQFVDIADPANAIPAGADRADMMQLLHGRSADGRWLIGVEVFVAMYEAVGLSWVARALGWRWLRPLADALYPVVARHRQRAPKWLSNVVFGRALRHAAERASASPCAEGACERRPS